MKKIIQQIKNERVSQNKKWGEQNHDPLHWNSILGEEIGEATKEVVDYTFCSKGEDQQIIILERLRVELIQSAAVIVAMIESLDRNELKNL